ncbi:MAG: DUF5343 domain-containing protein [Pseudomonadota bacterium]
MSDSPKKLSPPYATFTSVKKFMIGLGDAGLPAQIDASLFGSASGSIIYSTINALKYLKLIDNEGRPSQALKTIVHGGEEAFAANLRPVVEQGYPEFFDGAIDLKSITAKQFDDLVRDAHSVHGSTVDKIASFFIAACKETGIEISSHLANRKPIAPSRVSRKSAKQRKEEQSPPESSASQPSTAQAVQAKPLEYQLIDLMSEPDIEEEIKGSIWSLVQYLTARKAKNTTAPN